MSQSQQSRQTSAAKEALAALNRWHDESDHDEQFIEDARAILADGERVEREAMALALEMVLRAAYDLALACTNQAAIYGGTVGVRLRHAAGAFLGAVEVVRGEASPLTGDANQRAAASRTSGRAPTADQERKP